MLLTTSLMGQYTIETKILLTPPYPSNLDAYETYLSQSIVQITNTSSQPVEAYFQASITEASGKLTISTEGNTADALIIQPGTTLLSPLEIEDLFNGISFGDLQVSGLSKEEQRNILISRQLPEGDFSLCLRAFDINGVALSDPNSQDCTQFPLNFPERPIINRPLEDDIVLTDPMLNVNWLHNISDPVVQSRIEYEVKIIDMSEASDKELAMLDPGIVPVYEEQIGAFNFLEITNGIELDLIKGNRYAIRVKAIDPDGEVSFKFGGLSEVVAFQYGEEEEETEEPATIAAPSITSPSEDDYVTNTQGIPLTWEHEIEDENLADDFSYTLRVIDMDSLKLTSIDADDFSDDQEYIWDINILRKDTILVQGKENPMVRDRKYAMMITAAHINDERIDLANDGNSKIVSFIWGEQPKEEEEEDGCVGDCITALPTNQKEFPITKGNSYFMGSLLLTIDKVSKDASGGYKGEGHVDLKFMGNVKMSVTFEGLKANQAKFVFAGEAKAVYDATTPEIDGLVSFTAASTGVLDFDKAKEVSNTLRSTGKLVSALAGKKTTLPLGFDRDVDGEKVIIGITEMSITPEKAELGAIFTLDNPDWGERVPSFGANGICFNKNGFAKGFKLYLAEDYKIPLPNDAILTLKAVDNDDSDVKGTYVEVNCEGFKQGQITAEVPLPRKMLLPEDEEGKIKPDGNATILLSGTFAKAKNYILSASIGPCQIPGLEGFTFEMGNGYYDSSDNENPLNIKFPQGYDRATTDYTWKGVWFSNVSMKAPSDWMLSGEERTTFQMKDFIKDDAGISIKGSVENILGIDKGEIEGFAISIDELSLDIIRGQFKEVKMTGRMGLPILPEDNYLNYEGIVDKEVPIHQQQANNPNKNRMKMAFTVKPDEKGYDIDWLKAHIDFEQTSQFILKNDIKERGVAAHLSGKISLKSSIDDINENRDTGTPEIDIPGIKFEGMEISRMITKAGADVPKGQKNTGKDNMGGFRFKRPTFAFTGFDLQGASGAMADKTDIGIPDAPGDKEEETKEAKLNAFSISLDKVEFTFGDSNDEEVQMTAGTPVKLNVVPTVMLVGGANKKKGKKSEGFSISATGSFNINASISNKSSGSGVYFKYESIDIDSFAVASEVGPIGIEGSIGFYTKDETFGNGMVGDLAVKMPLVDVNLEARFGNTLNGNGDIDYPYWYLFGDVMKKDATGLVKVGPFFTLHGFNGGVYYHMKDGNPTASTAAERYTPSKDISLGVKAGITFSVVKSQLLWANTTFGMQFKEDYSLDEISLDGDAYMMQPEMEAVAGDEIDGVKIELNAKVNFKKQGNEEKSEVSFDADAAIYVNVADGLVKGNLEGGKTYQAVQGNVRIDSEKFSILVGTPSKPGRVEVGIPDLASVNATAYFMAGKGVNFEEAQLPKFIHDLLYSHTDGLTSSSSVSGYSSTRTGGIGNGVALGMNLDYQLNLKASILYANFRAMFGFDLIMRDYPGVTCVGSNGLMGINGYYANGQVYAGLSGDIGLDVDLFFYKGKFSLAKLQAALLLEGGLPNPIWVKGTARMSYEVFGGMIKGSTGFEVQLGDKCTPQQIDPFVGADIIADIDPGNISDVSVFAKPQVSLNAKLGIYEVPIVDKKGNRTIKKFRLKIGDYTLKQGNTSITTSRTKESDHKIILEPHAMLKPQTYHAVSITLKADEMVNGQWQPYKKNGSIWSVSGTRTFKTGNPPDHVVWENVKLTYPFHGESTYLHGENHFKEGFLQFGVPTNYLFRSETPTNQQWHSRVVVKWTKGTELLAKTNVLEKRGKFFTFKTPNDLPNNTGITCKVVREYYQNPYYDVNGRDVADVQGRSGDYTVDLQGKTYRNYTSNAPKDKVLFTFWFETSKFKTFEEKIRSSRNNSLVVKDEYYRPYSTWGRELQYNFNASEAFSYEEIGKRIILQSNTRNGGMIEVKEDYSSEMYKDLFNFFIFEKGIMGLMSSFKEDKTMYRLMGEGSSYLFNAYLKHINKGAFKRSIEPWGPTNNSFKNTEGLVGARYFRNNEHQMYSRALYMGDIDAQRTSDYAMAIAYTAHGIDQNLFDYCVNGAAENITTANDKVKTSVHSGAYKVYMSYWTPRVVNGKVKEYRSSRQTVTFRKN